MLPRSWWPLNFQCTHDPGKILFLIKDSAISCMPRCTIFCHEKVQLLIDGPDCGEIVQHYPPYETLHSSRQLWPVQIKSWWLCDRDFVILRVFQESDIMFMSTSLLNTPLSSKIPRTSRWIQITGKEDMHLRKRWASFFSGTSFWDRVTDNNRFRRRRSLSARVEEYAVYAADLQTLLNLKFSDRRI